MLALGVFTSLSPIPVRAEPGTPLVFSWGDDSYGQLGDGSPAADSRIPVPVLDAPNAVAVSAGFWHSLALAKDGKVWGWGSNHFGQIGGGTTTTVMSPVQIDGLSNVVHVSAGYLHNLAVRSDGTVWAWGRNDWGQLGDGTTTDRPEPIQVPGLGSATAVAAGRDHSLALLADGSMRAWGRNDWGQLGDGTTLQRLQPVEAEISDVAAIASGDYHSLAVRNDGTAWAWGSPGSLGNGTLLSSSTPVQVDDLTDVITIAGGNAHSVALRADGTVWSWGGGGRLGDGTDENAWSPVQSDISDVAAIAAGDRHTVAARKDGTVWAWGWNEQGQLGDGTITRRYSPVQSQGLEGITAVAAGNYHSLAVSTCQAEPLDSGIDLCRLEPGDVIAYRSISDDTQFHWSTLVGSYWTHVGVFVGWEEIGPASVPLIAHAHPQNPHGVDVEDLTATDFAIALSVDHPAVAVSRPLLPLEQRERVAEHTYDYVEGNALSYDLCHLSLGGSLGDDCRGPSRYYCSSFVWDMYLDSLGVDLDDGTDDRALAPGGWITPEQLLEGKPGTAIPRTIVQEFHF